MVNVLVGLDDTAQPHAAALTVLDACGRRATVEAVGAYQPAGAAFPHVVRPVASDPGPVAARSAVDEFVIALRTLANDNLADIDVRGRLVKGSLEQALIDTSGWADRILLIGCYRGLGRRIARRAKDRWLAQRARCPVTSATPMIRHVRGAGRRA